MTRAPLVPSMLPENCRCHTHGARRTSSLSLMLCFSTHHCSEGGNDSSVMHAKE